VDGFTKIGLVGTEYIRPGVSMNAALLEADTETFTAEIVCIS
jgi:hypothetical protein